MGVPGWGNVGALFRCDPKRVAEQGILGVAVVIHYPLLTDGRAKDKRLLMSCEDNNSGIKVDSRKEDKLLITEVVPSQV